VGVRWCLREYTLNYRWKNWEQNPFSKMGRLSQIYYDCFF
jgi:hypothetical protein